MVAGLRAIAPDQRFGRVLVVEDDELVRELLDSVLTNAGYEVTIAEDGRRALALLPATDPNVILLDLMMPVMNGRQFRQMQLAEHYPDPPLVILSASREATSIGSELHAAAILTKPFDLTDLLETVGELVAGDAAIVPGQDPPPGRTCASARPNNGRVGKN
jgi:CheY-like chemotaxis protein